MRMFLPSMHTSFTQIEAAPCWEEARSSVARPGGSTSSLFCTRKHSEDGSAMQATDHSIYHIWSLFLLTFLWPFPNHCCPLQPYSFFRTSDVINSLCLSGITVGHQPLWDPQDEHKYKRAADDCIALTVGLFSSSCHHRRVILGSHSSCKHTSQLDVKRYVPELQGEWGEAELQKENW